MDRRARIPSLEPFPSAVGNVDQSLDVASGLEVIDMTGVITGNADIECLQGTQPPFELVPPQVYPSACDMPRVERVRRSELYAVRDLQRGALVSPRVARKKRAPITIWHFLGGVVGLVSTLIGVANWVGA